MNAVGAIRQVILDDAVTVALLVSNTAVYPTILPQTKPYPSITLMIGANGQENSKWTPTASEDRIELVVGVWADTYDKAQNIDTAVRNAIDGYVGSVTTSDSVAHYFRDVAFKDRKDGYDQENKLFYREVTYRVIYLRDVPQLPFGPPWVSQAQAWFDSLPEYDSDESAILDGMSVGQVYLTADNHVTETGGLPKQIRT
jgi:hypothetical protein